MFFNRILNIVGHVLDMFQMCWGSNIKIFKNKWEPSGHVVASSEVSKTSWNNVFFQNIKLVQKMQNHHLNPWR